MLLSVYAIALCYNFYPHRVPFSVRDIESLACTNWSLTIE
jgi:hypothetical protein